MSSEIAQSCTDTKYFVKRIHYQQRTESPEFNDNCQSIHFSCLQDLSDSLLNYLDIILDNNSVKTFNIDITATSSTNYTLSGTDRTGNISGNDPDLIFNVGDTINFVVSASGHPFYLKTVAGTGTGNTISGITNNGTTNQTITWTPTSAGTFYYQCSLHGGMVGTITIQ